MDFIDEMAVVVDELPSFILGERHEGIGGNWITRDQNDIPSGVKSVRQPQHLRASPDDGPGRNIAEVIPDDGGY